MSFRRGAALLQVLVMAAVLIALAMAVIKWQLQRHTMSSKAAERTRLELDARGSSDLISSCLASRGYPSGSCHPTPAQAACVPAGVTASFSGVPPDCEVKITTGR